MTSWPASVVLKAYESNNLFGLQVRGEREAQERLRTVKHAFGTVIRLVL